MTKETLKKANKLVNELEKCKSNLQKIEYTQSESYVIRESSLYCNGIEDIVKIPKSLFRVIGKLIECYYIQEIDKLQKELDDL